MSGSSRYDVAVPPQSAPDGRAGDPEHAKNPSYPHRVHVHERPRLRATLDSWDARIAEAGRSLQSGAGDDPTRRRLHAQMLGARDQLAHAARRMPMEVGHLYEEDKHSFDQAVAALERLFKAWG